MAIKPMLCKASVVQNILNDKQTQDRRPVKLEVGRDNRFSVGANVWMNINDPRAINYAPYQPGDIIWVRETWAHDAPTLEDCRQRLKDGLSGGLPYGPYFRADPVHENTGLRWRPSIHMPKWACRLFLKVNAVRGERIQDISEEDCLAEGVFEQPGGFAYQFPDGHWERTHDPRLTFKFLWNSIYPGSWERNEWVWVYEFEKTERPDGWPETKQEAA